MQTIIGVVVALAALVATAVIVRALTISGLKKDADSEIGTAKKKAREIIDDALKTAETKKRNSRSKKSRSRARMSWKKSPASADRS